MKGIVIAGGEGSRLAPATATTSKCLLSVYNKPMVYYPLSVLMLAGIRDILVISRPRDINAYATHLQDGHQWGISITYAEQENPRGGIGEAFIIGRDFVGDGPCSLVLGDNLFFGQGLQNRLRGALERHRGATVFAYQVRDPGKFGVVSFDEYGQASELIEKPAHPRSNWAVTGLYIYDNSVLDVARDTPPGNRGELEITDINCHYLQSGMLRVERLGPGFAWFDAGTPDSLLEASHFVRTIERRQHQSCAVPEEIAFQNGWIDQAQLQRLGQDIRRSDYGRYLVRLAEGKALAGSWE
ncbi:MAG: glucose-1-phosphate thymidylyltransferase RfbA [Rhodobacteraceae bacterium]|nr:glucose-1-phosphate thymidylyltransferase RfbA [Paracoccaceae bacterium]